MTVRVARMVRDAVGGVPGSHLARSGRVMIVGSRELTGFRESSTVTSSQGADRDGRTGSRSLHHGPD